MNRSDIMRISALFEIALGSASLIAARFWIGTTNIVGRHVSHGDTTEAFEAQSAAEAEYATESYFCGIADCIRFLKYIEGTRSK